MDYKKDLTKNKNLVVCLRKFFKHPISNFSSKDLPVCIPNANISAVIIPFIIIENIPFVIIEKRSVTVKQPLELSFPGGKKEDHEKSILFTALREAKEEIGLDEKIISKVKFCGVFANHKTVIYVFAALFKENLIRKTFGSKLKSEILNIISSQILNINKSEVEKVIFFPLEILMQKPNEFEIVYSGKIKKMPQSEKLSNLLDNSYIENGKYKPYSRIIYYWEYNDEVLWGYSAEIMLEVVKSIAEEN